jgi:hypothetical protein
MTSRRLFLPVLLICLLTAGLALASSAAAQPKAGEGTSPADMSLAGEVDLLKGTALYDPATGAATFTLTLREAPGTNTEEESPRVEYGGVVVTATRPCTEAGLEEEEKAGGGFPAFEAIGFSKPEAGEPEAASLYLTKPLSEPPNLAELGPATKSVAGTAVTLSGSDSRAVNGPFTCVEVIAIQQDEPHGHDILLFPLVALPEPPPAVVPTPPVPAPAAAPAVAVLSVGKLKPLTLKPEKWTPLRIKVTNTGGTATVPGSLKLKLPRGLKVRPVSARQQVPAIQPGGSWTVAFRVKPTEKTKPKSTISFVAQAGSVIARGSLVATLSAP